MATKFKTVPCENATRRIFEGQLRVCSTDKDKNYKVELLLMNEEPNGNKWKFINAAEHMSEVEDIPILYSVINGKIGNSHDFSIVYGDDGKPYPSFIGAEDEHPYGWIPKTINSERNPRMKVIDGTEWLTATGYLPNYYNREMISEIKRNNGQMPISIETIVHQNHMEGDIEVEEEYSIIGVTILGVSTKPAFAGAKARKLALNSEQLKELKLRVASLASADSNNEPQTQNIKTNKENKKAMKNLNLEDLQAKFNGYTPIAVDGMNVALLSDSGRACSYTFGENEDGVLPEKIIEGVKVNCTFGEGDSAVPVSEQALLGAYRAKLNAAQAALADLTKDNEELKVKLNAMTEAENKRRREAVKAAIKDELKANQACDEGISDDFCNDLLADESVAKLAAMEDNGNFNGDVKARESVAARCMAKVRQAMIERRNAKTPQYIWANGGTNEPVAEHNDVDDLIAEYTTNRH